MIKDVPSLELLLKALNQVPYLASKNIYRVANYFLNLDQEKLEQFCAVEAYWAPYEAGSPNASLGKSL